MDFDQTRLYFSHQQLQRQPDGADEERPDNADENQDVWTKSYLFSIKQMKKYIDGNHAF